VSAVTLFLERAQAIDPEFLLSEENARAVAELCVRLDGLPLAIELAAVRSNLLSPRMILARLEERVSLLRWGARDLPERQQTLRSAIGWSYDLLDARGQAFFRRLGVFSSGFTMEAARAVTCADREHEVLDGLASLVDKSLVQVEGRGAEDVRYRLLESMREYALEQLEIQEELEEARRAHALYFLALAERAEPELIGREQRAWFLRLEQEHDNLRAALRWLASRDEDAVPALRLAAALEQFWIRGHMAEGRCFLEDLVGRAPGEAIDPRTRAKALRSLGVLLLYQGESAGARAALQCALTLARSANDAHGVTVSLIYLGIHAHLSGSSEESTPVLEEALAGARRAGDARGSARALHELGINALYARDHARAERLLSEARAGYCSIGDERTMAEALLWLGMAVRERGDASRAIALVRQAVGISRRLEDRSVLNMCTDTVLWLTGDTADPERLARLIGVNEALHQITGLADSVWEHTLVAPAVGALAAQLDDERVAAARTEAYALSRERMAELALEALDEAANAVAHHAKPAGPRRHGVLSPRELEVLRLVAEGLPNQAIAGRLFITERTVRFHLTSIFGKLGADNRTQAVTLARQQGVSSSGTLATSW
jgi:DNA-binding CsgD family transcriptional regulator